MEEPMLKTHVRSCAFCEAACGIEVIADHASRAIVRVTGDKLDPFSRGHICPKAYALTELQSDPDRLRKPMRRKGRDFEEIGWEEAIDVAAAGLGDVLKRHGSDSIGYYFGNPIGHNPELVLYSGLLAECLQTKQVYSPGTLDQTPKFVSAALMFGGVLIQALADVDRTEYLIIMGSNPVVSQGSLMVAPGIGRRIKDVRKRGGRVVVIDPRRTETAEIASEYVPIRPGTDAYLLLAMLDVIFKEGRVRLGRADGLVKNLDILKALAARYPAGRVARVTGVPADTIVRLAREFAAAPSAVIHGRTGTCTQRFGTLASGLIDAFNTVTGNLDRPGGAMFSAGGVPLAMHFNQAFEGDVPPIGRWHTRVDRLPEAYGLLPTAALANEMLTPGSGQIRGFVTLAGNPMLSNPDGGKLRKGLVSLEFMLSFDIYINETTRHADLIIPGPSYVEHSDFQAVTAFETIRKFVKWSPPIFDKADGAPADWEIFAGIAARLKGTTAAALEEAYVSDMLKKALSIGRPECRNVSFAAARAALGDAPGADRLYDIMLRAGSYGDAFGAVPDGLSLEKLKQHAHGMDFGPLTEALPGVLRTPDRLIDLAPPLIVQDFPRLESALETLETDRSLLLIGRRNPRSKNAWMHNIRLLNKGKIDCTLLVNPADAASYGLVTGSNVRLSSHVGTIDVLVEVSDEVMPGVVSLPHGWGHDMPDTRQRIANSRPGANANWIIDSGHLDVPSATTILNGVAVKLESLPANIL
jgi:anaerobic selenocysteine-containing dehydrogenase